MSEPKTVADAAREGFYGTPTDEDTTKLIDEADKQFMKWANEIGTTMDDEQFEKVKITFIAGYLLGKSR